MLDYGFFFRNEHPVNDLTESLGDYELFVSAYNRSERISRVFEQVSSKRKIWLLHPEYQFAKTDYPSSGEIVEPASIQESAQVDALLSAIASSGYLAGPICIDSTGFMRATLCLLLAQLERTGHKELDVLYSEPDYYESQELTPFATASSGVARVVQGFGGSHNSGEPEHLILGVGYDHKLVNEVVKERDGASVVPLFSFPSLSADMYQQSVLRSSEAGEVTRAQGWVTNRRFAPANDPFAVAEVLRDIVRGIDSQPFSVLPNIYLAPLATKAQAVGFVFYYLREGRDRGAMSLVLPESRSYSRETSKGLKRLWSYTLEFA